MTKIKLVLLLFFTCTQVNAEKRPVRPESIHIQALKRPIHPITPENTTPPLHQKNHDEISQAPVRRPKENNEKIEKSDDEKSIARPIAKHFAIGAVTAALTTTAAALTAAGSAELFENAGQDVPPPPVQETPTEMEISFDVAPIQTSSMPSFSQGDDDGDGE